MRRKTPITNKKYAELTEKQRNFIEFFIQSQNATQSAIKAGYSEKTASITGHEMKTALMPFIEKRMKEVSKKKIASTDEILEMLTRIARGQEKDAFGLDTTNQDKLKALELLGKANQLYVDKVKQETNFDINVSLTDEGETEAIEGETVAPLELEEGVD